MGSKVEGGSTGSRNPGKQKEEEITMPEFICEDEFAGPVQVGLRVDATEQKVSILLDHVKIATFKTVDDKGVLCIHALKPQDVFYLSAKGMGMIYDTYIAWHAEGRED
jgi:hypothetical protein